MKLMSPVQIAGEFLKNLRDHVGLTQQELADRVHVSLSLISAIERGTKRARTELIALVDKELDAHGALMAIWPVTYSGFYSPEYLADLEIDAARIHDWDNRVIPGLLQTQNYARAHLRSSKLADTTEQIDEQVATRIGRQQIFSVDSPPTSWFVLDESVLLRPFGGKAVMHEQLSRLENLADQPRIVIQVMPFKAIRHPGTEGPLRIMEFTDKPPLWYTEGWYSGRITDDKEEVAEAMTNFNLIRASALSPDESAELIVSVRGTRYE